MFSECLCYNLVSCKVSSKLERVVYVCFFLFFRKCFRETLKKKSSPVLAISGDGSSCRVLSVRIYVCMIVHTYICMYDCTYVYMYV